MKLVFVEETSFRPKFEIGPGEASPRIAEFEFRDQ